MKLRKEPILMYVCDTWAMEKLIQLKKEAVKMCFSKKRNNQVHVQMIMDRTEKQKGHIPWTHVEKYIRILITTGEQEGMREKLE